MSEQRSRWRFRSILLKLFFRKDQGRLPERTPDGRRYLGKLPALEQEEQQQRGGDASETRSESLGEYTEVRIGVKKFRQDGKRLVRDEACRKRGGSALEKDAGERRGELFEIGTEEQVEHEGVSKRCE